MQLETMHQRKNSKYSTLKLSSVPEPQQTMQTKKEEVNSYGGRYCTRTSAQCISVLLRLMCLSHLVWTIGRIGME